MGGLKSYLLMAPTMKADTSTIKGMELEFATIPTVSTMRAHL